MAVLTAVVGEGGAELGGSATVAFVHGSGPATSDIVVEWDLDGDGDYSEAVEDVTDYLLEGESMTGRDFPSQLTGRAGPGKVSLSLLNTDGRFGYFNTASPLNQAPFAVRSGGRIRIRSADAANPDPELLARDRFRGSGALGSDELGHAWQAETSATFTRQSDSTGRTLAVHSGAKGDVAIATLDVAEDFYAQLRIRHRDASNNIGIVYRFDDTDNYGLAYVGSHVLELGEFVAGVWSLFASVAIEDRDDITLGLGVTGTTATVYLDGVALLEDLAYTSTSTRLGVRANWQEQRAPSVDEFHVWAELAAGETEGILWTGKVTAVTPYAPLGGPATVTVDAEGPLLDAAMVDVDPPSSVGPTSTSTGTRTGVLVGATLSAAQLLHPPGPIDVGTVTPGAVGVSRTKALDMARLIEEVELGFLYETQEGRIGFDGRGARVAGPPEAVFSDAEGAQFSYDGLELGDWRREVINRVTARLAPQLPNLETIFGTQADNAFGVDTNVAFPLPTDTIDDAEVGDLFVVVIASSVGASGREWESPVGWTEFRRLGDFLGKLRIYAKVLEEGDFGATLTLYDDNSSGGAWVYRGFLIKRWYGDIDQGLLVSDSAGVGQPNTLTAARNGAITPPVVFPPWGPGPSLFLSIRAGMTSAVGVTVGTLTDDYAPNGYGNATGSAITSPAKAASEVALQLAVRDACVEVEAPSTWAAGAGVFAGFDYAEAVTIAVRGYAGDPPEASGGLIVQVDDHASQDTYGAILPHENAAELFADEDDATAYGEAVLVRHATEKPILTLTFKANKNAAYRAQALRRRVGHRIYVEALSTANLGITGEFYIEAIGHRFAEGGTDWQVTWQLSPA